MEVIEYFQNNPHIIVIGFRHSDDSFEYSDDGEPLKGRETWIF